LEIVVSPARGENRLCSHPLTKSVILSQKIQLIEFLAIFFLRFFHLSHHLCEGGYTCDFLRALVTRQFSKTSHHHRKQKIARVAAALDCEHSLFLPDFSEKLASSASEGKRK